MKVEKGDIAKIEYTGTLDDGRQFDTNIGKAPFEVEVGAGEVIKGFDSALVGMEEGEEKTVTITAKDAYGERDDKLEQTLPKSKLPKDIPYQKGVILKFKHKDGRVFMALVKDVKGEDIVLDLNHPLAGKNLTFKIKVLGIEKDSSEAAE
jgi:FKBP-type peptidyl-prolyl cis-trans isomerase 2